MSQTTERTRALHPYAAAALVFGSSAAVLVLEITSLRLIAPYVGITLETNTAVIGFALAAIALGAWAGGRVADLRDPRRLIGPLLLAGGALVLLVTPIVRFVADWVGPSQAASVALLLAAITVFAPAALLSAVPPMVVKLQLASLSETGTVVGRLSGISTLGAIVATFLTGFVLVALIPTSVILLTTGGLLAVGGLAMILASRDSARSGRSGSTGRAAAQPPTAALLTLAIVAAGLGILAPQPCDTETRYHCASVTSDSERAGGRLLILDTLRHSYVDLGDPTHLEFAYTRAIAAALDAQATPGAPLSVLHIGGGGMTLPRYLLETRPGGVNRVVEVDPGVVAVDRERLALPDDEDLQVTVGDGRVSLAMAATDGADVVVGDAFGGVAVPWHLTTREAVSDVARILVPGGLYALNVIDHDPLDFARAEIATVASVFDHVLVVSPSGRLVGDDGGNLVVLASDQPIDRASIVAGMLDRGTPMSMVDEAELEEFLGEEPLILTDDFAPVDQLLTPFG